MKTLNFFLTIPRWRRSRYIIAPRAGRLVQKEIVSPAPSQHPAGLLLLQTVALGAELGSLFQHPAEQRLSRGGGYAGALELQDLIALP